MQGNQGNSNDWQKESPRVGSYYRNAIFTIAATWAASNDGGCLPFEWCTNMPINMHYLKEFASAGMKLRHGPSHVVDNLRRELFDYPERKRAVFDLLRCVLFERGWVLQEVALSQHVLWFTRTGVYWSCEDVVADSFEGPLSFMALDTPTHFFRSKLIQFPTNRDDKWYFLMSVYSAMRLSFAEDKLPALSGLCTFADPNNEDQYLAGIWKSTILHGLSWSCKGPEPMEKTSLKDNKLPSWSFLSTSRIVEFNILYSGGLIQTEKFLESLEVVSEMIKLRYDDIHGQISDARLCLKITPVEIVIINSTIPEENLGEWNLWDWNELEWHAEPTVQNGKLVLTYCRTVWKYPISTMNRIRFDRDPGVLSNKKLRLGALLLLEDSTLLERFPHRQYHLGLILIQPTENPSTYTRIGYCSADLALAQMKALDREKLVRTRITLV